MANHALVVLEEALRARKLDRTLTTTLPPPDKDGGVAPTAMAGLDAVLYPTAHACAAGAPGVGGGLPRGQLSEIAGPRSSGRTTLLLQVVAAATRRGEIAALVDTFDRLDLASVVSAGIDLDRLLWIRGYDIRAQGSGPGAFVDRIVGRALKAFNLVLQAGGFGVVALDLADAPLAALNRIPFTTWLRVQRTIEGERHRVRAGRAAAAGAQRGRPDAFTGRPDAVGRPRHEPSGLRRPPARRHGDDRTRHLTQAASGRGKSLLVLRCTGARCLGLVRQLLTFVFSEQRDGSCSSSRRESDAARGVPSPAAHR